MVFSVGANEAHPLVECSNKGLCDGKLGECDCFDNKDGVAWAATRSKMCSSASEKKVVVNFDTRKIRHSRCFPGTSEPGRDREWTGKGPGESRSFPRTRRATSPFEL